jgi:hypothetical protein
VRLRWSKKRGRAIISTLCHWKRIQSRSAEFQASRIVGHWENRPKDLTAVSNYKCCHRGANHDLDTRRNNPGNIQGGSERSDGVWPRIQLSNREWTGIAQAELFRSVILNLKNRSKMNRFLKAVRGSEKLRGFSNDVIFLGLGRGKHVKQNSRRRRR